MADSSGSQEIPDSQATYFESSPNDQDTDQIPSGTVLSESQDFQLIDTSNTEEYASEPPLDVFDDNPDFTGENGTVCSDSVKVNLSQDELLIGRGDGGKNKKLVADYKEQFKNCLEDDIEDTLVNDSDTSFQECASSQTSSHQRDKQIRVESMKRKASTGDCQTSKFKRTFSGNDALSIERFKDAALSQETEDPNIVEETQEIPDSQVQNGCNKTVDVVLETESIKLSETNADGNLNDSSNLFQSDLSCYKQGGLDNNPDKADENEVEANLQKMFESDNKESSLAATEIIKSTGSIADNEVERNLEKMFDNESDDDNEDIRINKANSMNECDVINSLTAEEKSEQVMSPQTDIMKQLLSNHDGESELSEVTSTNSDWKLTSTVNGTETKDSSSVGNGSPSREVLSRKSIEVIFDKATAKSKPQEIVEIDDSGEKIVLDSSHEDNSKVIGRADVSDSGTVYKSCLDKSNSTASFKSLKISQESALDNTKLNGSTHSKSNEAEKSNTSDVNIEEIMKKYGKQQNYEQASIEKSSLVTVSDSDNSLIEDSAKNRFYENSRPHLENMKLSQIERDIFFTVRLKCSLSIDENSKDICQKEILNAVCEPSVLNQSKHQKLIDSSTCGSLADISASDNKDGSPASVNSNPMLYQLPSINYRQSIVSTVSSSSSGSSGYPAAKILSRDSLFSQPHGPAKHAKKHFADLSPEEKQTWETFEKFGKEWKNSSILVSSLFNFLNNEIVAGDCANNANILVDSEALRSSTPETGTRKKISKKSSSKGVKESRVTKNPKNPRSSKKALNKVVQKLIETDAEAEINMSFPSTPKHNRAVDATPNVDNDLMELLDKNVFARWSLKPTHFYPGKVIDIVKSKVLVEFLDGKTKQMTKDFVLPIDGNLEVGLSVYAYTSEDEYGSSVMIVDVKEVDGKTIYTVETDEGNKVDVTIADIFLTADQAKLVKEQRVQTVSVPSTPRQAGDISLDNVLPEERRSRRGNTSVLSRTRSRNLSSSVLNDSVGNVKPSVSGLQLKKSRSNTVASSERTSDSNPSGSEESCKPLLGVQEEVVGSLDQQIIKGPPSKVKGKGRSRKKPDSKEDIENLGPVPETNSEIFKGMSFILSCVSLETLEKYQVSQPSNDSESEPGTENEEQWVKRPFVRNRLKEQLISGGGKVYDNFEDIPPEEYAITKHITNVPNLTKKALLCLSVGIKTYNHQWVIRSCLENKPIQLADEELPSGWSLEKRAYIDSYQRSKERPFEHTAVAIPHVVSEGEFSQFWKRICENAGASVQLLKNQDDSFVQCTVVLANKKCPSWVMEKADAWQIPVVSTTWVVQCLIEGKLCAPDAKAEYKYSANES
ncbi:hypothetical protein QAD02_019463 [Eretmocerus hayati]|uniref:Uncharacterized protein n=1 Tax=Eretmocerus hayati TaxID=131215 RepID=A0ACC2PKV6_9HYME|nr:hypothetical protein QAD02_019463 [Eretmocerus hayati]